MVSRLFCSLLLVSSLVIAIPGCKSGDPEVQYEELISKAEQYKKDEKYEEARITLMSAIDAKPKEAEPYFKLAEVVLQQQKFGDAVENYQTALNLDPNFWEARLKLAALMLASKRVEIAESHLVELTKTHGDNLDVQVLQANLENTKGNRDKARELLQSLLEKYPTKAAVFTSLANIEIAEGHMNEAATLYEKVSELEPQNDGVKLALADIYIRRGETERGHIIIEKLIEENPKNTTLRFRFGEYLLTKSQTEGALEQYTQILIIDPLKHYARDRLYDMFLIRKVVEQARDLTTALKQHAPSDPGVLYFEGRDKELDGDKEGALALYLKAIPGLNNFAPAFRRAGLLEIEIGKTREGVEHLQQAIAIDPNDVGARLGLAKDQFAKKQLAQAKQHLSAVLSRYPKQIGANILAADIALIEGNTAGARKIYQVMIDNFPEHPINYMKLALLEERENHQDKAEQLYRKALSFDDNVSVAARRLAAIISKDNGLPAAIVEIEKLANESKNSKDQYYLLIGTLYASTNSKDSLEKARGYFEKSIEINPNAFSAYYALARIDGYFGNVEEAIAKYNKALEINPKLLPVKMLLGLSYEAKANFDEAIATYADILKDNPRFGPAANNLAWLYAEGKGGDLDSALALAKVAKEEMPAVGGVADTLGWIYFKRGNAQLALPLLREAVDSEESQSEDAQVNPEVRYHLAAVLDALGEKQEAKKVIATVATQIKEDHPKYAEIKALESKLQ